MVHLKENTILCSGHTSRHIYKTAKDLVVDLKKLNIPNLPFIPTVFGRRDEEWLIVEIGEVQVHLFVESFRKEMDLLERWLNPAPEDYIGEIPPRRRSWRERSERRWEGARAVEGGEGAAGAATRRGVAEAPARTR